MRKHGDSVKKSWRLVNCSATCKFIWSGRMKGDVVSPPQRQLRTVSFIVMIISKKRQPQVGTRALYPGFRLSGASVPCSVYGRSAKLSAILGASPMYPLFIPIIRLPRIMSNQEPNVANAEPENESQMFPKLPSVVIIVF